MPGKGKGNHSIRPEEATISNQYPVHADLACTITPGAVVRIESHDPNDCRLVVDANATEPFGVILSASGKPYPHKDGTVSMTCEIDVMPEAGFEHSAPVRPQEALRAILWETP